MNSAILAALLKYGPIVLKWVADYGLPEVIKWLESRKKTEAYPEAPHQSASLRGVAPRGASPSFTPKAIPTTPGPDVVSANHALASGSSALMAAVEAAGTLLTSISQAQRMVMAALGSINQQ